VGEVGWGATGVGCWAGGRTEGCGACNGESWRGVGLIGGVGTGGAG
jgi:hypothetical protein